MFESKFRPVISPAMLCYPDIVVALPLQIAMAIFYTWMNCVYIRVLQPLKASYTYLHVRMQDLYDNIKGSVRSDYE